MRKLYACLRVQDFAVAVVLRGRRSQPAVVFSGAAPNVYVYEANAAARATGIRAGMTLSQAQGRSLQQTLVAEPRNEQAEQQAQRELLEAAQLVSPRVEDRSGVGDASGRHVAPSTPGDSAVGVRPRGTTGHGARTCDRHRVRLVARHSPRG